MFYKMRGSRLHLLLTGVIVMLLLAACQTKQLYEQNTIYKVFFVIRHHNAYHYKNIWLQLSTKAPNDSVSKQTLNLNLADDEKGWLGTGMDDIYDQRIPINTEPLHLKKGLYKFALQHTMREDPLENILSTGIRVEKVKP